MKPYLICFESHNLALAQAGFDVCLAIITLELTLQVVISADVQQFWREQDAVFEKQLLSLNEFGGVALYMVGEFAVSSHFEAISESTLKQLKENAFGLNF